MSNASGYQLPPGIQMPEPYTHRLSSQIWFFSGVQAGLEGRSSPQEAALALSTGTQVAAAYQAGLTAGREKRAELEAPAHKIPVPEQFSRTLQEKVWFLQGVDDGLSGRDFDTPFGLSQRSAADLLQAYRTGYHTGKRAAE